MPPPLGHFTSVGAVEVFEQAWEVTPPDISEFWSRHPQQPLRLLLALSAIDLVLLVFYRADIDRHRITGAATRTPLEPVADRWLASDR